MLIRSSTRSPLVAGCFPPPVAIILMTAPVLYPIVVLSGFDPYWFAVILTINMEIGLITPPVGLNLFVINGIAPDVKLQTILRGALPFVLLMALGIVILCFFPRSPPGYRTGCSGRSSANDVYRVWRYTARGIFPGLIALDSGRSPRWGALAGTMAGLLGIGGGALIVPVLVIVFETQGVDRSLITMQAALGTSLATISLHRAVLGAGAPPAQRGQVGDHPVYSRNYDRGGLAGRGDCRCAACRTLQIMFVVFMFAIAVHPALAATASRTLPGSVGISLAGTAIGAASSLFGVGGGSMSVPFMTGGSVPVRQAIATRRLSDCRSR